MKFPYNQVLVIKTQYQAGKIDREAAKEQLAYLLDLKDDNDFCEQAAGETFKPVSYGPLLRLSDLCNTLRLWARVYSTPLPDDEEYTKQNRLKLSEAASYVDLQISKSCLLDRLFFQEEGLRTIPCPVHKGRWSGCNWDSPGCACRNGANVTGWLTADNGYSEDPEAPLCDFCGKPPLKQGLWSNRYDGKHGHSDCMNEADDKRRLEPRWIDKHSITCHNCGELADEREAFKLPDGEGELCARCTKEAEMS